MSHCLPRGKHSSNKGPNAICSPRGCWLISVTLLPHFCIFFACAHFNESKSQPQTLRSIEWTDNGRLSIGLSKEFEYGLGKSCVQHCTALQHSTKTIYLTPLDLHFGCRNSKFWQIISTRTLGQSSVEEKGNLAGGKLILSPCQMRQMPIKQFDGSFLDHCSTISLPSPFLSPSHFPVGKNNDPKPVVRQPSDRQKTLYELQTKFSTAVFDL